MPVVYLLPSRPAPCLPLLCLESKLPTPADDISPTPLTSDFWLSLATGRHWKGPGGKKEGISQCISLFLSTWGGDDSPSLAVSPAWFLLSLVQCTSEQLQLLASGNTMCSLCTTCPQVAAAFCYCKSWGGFTVLCLAFQLI